MFSKASFLLKCKIQTLCVKTNISMSFTPPVVMDEDCARILYHPHENFTMCQRVQEIRMNEENKDSRKQMEPDFSRLCIELMGSQIKDSSSIEGFECDAIIEFTSMQEPDVLSRATIKVDKASGMTNEIIEFDELLLTKMIGM